MLVNGLVIAIVVWLTGVAVKDYACYLVFQSTHSGAIINSVFNATLQGYLWKMILAAVILAVFIHYFLIRKILNPLRKLACSTRQMSAGIYPEPIAESSQDEVGQLTRDFNHLIQELQHNEKLRKNMLIDISHDLRTPLSNLTGYLEGLGNGIIEGSPELFQSLHEEAMRLNHLVEQFHQLTIWESRPAVVMNRKSIHMAQLLKSAQHSFEWKSREKDIMISVNAETAHVEADEQGCKGIVDNLIQNAIVYNTGSWIEIKGFITDTGREYRVEVRNPGQPIGEEQKAMLFERFYRADGSRSRVTGGSGLGLSIVREIVKRHGGKSGIDIHNGVYTSWFTLPTSNRKAAE